VRRPTSNAASIKSIKALGARNTYTDEQLGAMSQAQLDSLVALAGVKTEAPRAAVDFGVAGARDTSSATEAPAPPDMAEAIRAARGIKA
jgi:hypothetical protein